MDWQPSEAEYSRMLTDLVDAEAAGVAALKEHIEQNITRLDSNYASWLQDRIREIQDSDETMASRFRAIEARISNLAATGDYRKAVFDENVPRNPKEVVLGLARRVELGQITLVDAAEQSIDMLSKFDLSDILIDLYELLQGIQNASDAGDYVSLAVVLYELSRRYPADQMGNLYQVAIYALTAKGGQLVRQGAAAEAVSLYEQALAIAEENSDATREVGILMALAELYQHYVDLASERDRFTRSLTYYERALQISEEAGAQLETAEALLGKGYSMLMLGDRDAAQLIQRGLKLYQSTPGAQQDVLDGWRTTLAQASNTYTAIAYGLERQADFQGALDATETARQLAVASNDEKMEARRLADEGYIYVRLGRMDDAKSIFRKAGAIHSRLGDSFAAANLSNTMASMLLRNGEWRDAIELWGMAYVFYSEASRPEDMATVALNLGEVYRLEFGDLEKVERCIRYCLSKIEGMEALNQRAFALRMTGALQLERGEYAPAFLSFSEAIDLVQRIGDLWSEQLFRVQRGQLLENHLFRLEEAEADYRQAVELLESVRDDLRTGTNRVQFQSQMADAYAYLIPLLVSRHASGEAYAYAERARSRHLSELLSRRPLRQPDGLLARPDLVEAEARLLARIIEMEQAEQIGIEVDEQHSRWSGELDSIWSEIAEIDDECRAYVDMRRGPKLSFIETRLLLQSAD